MNGKIQKVKQNKKIVAIICVMLMVTSMLSIGAYAYTDTSINGVDFTDMPFTMSQYPNQANSFVAGTASGGNYLIWFDYDANYYLAGYKTGSSYYVVAISDNNYGHVKYYYNRTSAGAYTDTAVSTINGYWYHIVSSYDLITASETIPLFNSSQELFQAFADWIENPPVEYNSSSLRNYALPAGNAIILNVGGINGTGSISQTTVDAYWTYATNIAGGSTRSVPNPITVPLNFTSQYTWTSIGKKNLLGQYHNFETSFSYSGGTSPTLYYVIVNPTVNDYISGDGVQTPIRENATIYISATEINSFQIVQLNTEYSYGGVWQAEQSGDTATGTYNPDTQEWEVTNDTTGDPFVPTFGGDNTISSGSTSIRDFLQQIANTISGFFNGAIGAVSTLVNAGKDFFNVLIGLYSWLPPSVYAVLTSALVIVITIGVIKVFI